MHTWLLGLHLNLEQAIISPQDSFLNYLTSVLSRLSASKVMPACKITSINSRISHYAPFNTRRRLHLRFLQFWIKMLVTTHTALGHSDPTGFRISHTSTLVQQTRSSSRSPIASPGAHPVLLHQCITSRIGSQLADSSSLRTVVTSRVVPTYQLAGIGIIRLALLQWWHQFMFHIAQKTELGR